MKKYYFLFLALCISFSVKAQDDPNLLGTWYLHYIETNGSILNVPSGATLPLEVYSSTQIEPIFGSSICNGFSASYQISNSNSSIQLTNVVTTLAICPSSFETIHLNIIENQATNFFDYTIDLQAEILVMTDLLGEKLVYGRQVLSTEENEAFSSSITLYPNPVEKQLFMTGISLNSQASYSIYSITGNVIVSERSLTQSSLDVTQLKAGMYFIKFEQQGKTAVKKFVKG